MEIPDDCQVFLFGVGDSDYVAERLDVAKRVAANLGVSISDVIAMTQVVATEALARVNLDVGEMLSANTQRIAEKTITYKCLLAALDEVAAGMK